MRINKVLWWIPIVGIIYIFYMGYKYGFVTEISNPLKFWTSIIWATMQAISFLSPLLIALI